MPSENLLTDDIELDEDIDESEVEEAEGEVEEDEEDADEDSGSSSDEPEDLADAFQRLRQMDADDAEGDVEGDGEFESEEDDGPEEDESNDPDGDDAEGYEDDRGPSVIADRADYEAAGKELIRRINQQAMQVAVREFQDHGIKGFTMNDLTRRDQRTGRITYANPDDPNRPFSNRMEAQQWLDSFNKQVETELRRRAMEMRGELVKQSSPTIRMLQFAPRYDGMSQRQQAVFEELVSDYEIRDDKGNIVGYSCDLDKAASAAERIAGRMGKPKQRKAAVAKKTIRKPAMDMNTKGSSGSTGNREPKTLEDAFKLLREQQKGN